VLSVAAFFSRAPNVPSARDDFLMAAMYFGVVASIKTAGFLISTAFSASWRRQAMLRAVMVSAFLGFVSPVAALIASAILSPLVLPLFRSGPAWLAMTLLYGVPGAALGLAAPWIARGWESRRARRVQP
jgi:hypothetical protein